MTFRDSAPRATLAAAFFLGALLGGLPVAAQQTSEPSLPLFIVELTTGPGWLADKPFQQQPHATDHSANLRRLRETGMLLLGAR